MTKHFGASDVRRLGAAQAVDNVEYRTLDAEHMDLDGGRLAPVMRALADEERRETRSALIDNLSPHRRTDGSYLIPARAWAVLAR